MAGEILDLNNHRRAAAHTEVVLRERWHRGHAWSSAAATAATPGLLPRLVSAAQLGVAAGSSATSYQRPASSHTKRSWQMRRTSA